MNFMAVWPQEVSPGKFKPFVRVITMNDVEASAPAMKKMSALKAGPLPKGSAQMKCETCGKAPVTETKIAHPYTPRGDPSRSPRALLMSSV